MNYRVRVYKLWGKGSPVDFRVRVLKFRIE